MGIKNRELLELNLALVRNERATRRSKWLTPETMRGAEDTLVWLLAGKASPAPLSTKWADPTNERHLSLEAEFAEEVWYDHQPGNAVLSDAATSGIARSYAEGVSRTLTWAYGATEDDAAGRDDDDIREITEDLGLLPAH